MITSDPDNNTEILFPKNQESPHLYYNKNHIAIPDDTKVLRMGDYEGLDYICVIFSSDELDIGTIKRNIKTTNGNFEEKVYKSLSGIITNLNGLLFSANSAKFENQHDKYVVPIIFKIKHS